MSRIKTREPGDEFQALTPQKLFSQDRPRKRRMVWSDDDLDSNKQASSTLSEKEPDNIKDAEVIVGQIYDNKAKSQTSTSNITSDSCIGLTREEESAVEAGVGSGHVVKSAVPDSGPCIKNDMFSDLRARLPGVIEPSNSSLQGEAESAVDSNLDGVMTLEDRILSEFYKRQSDPRFKSNVGDIIKEELDRVKGFCQIPRWLSNVLHRLPLSLNSSKVLDTLIKLSINYKSLEFNVGYSVLTIMSGVQKQNLAKAILTLESRGLISRRWDGKSSKSSYRLIFLENYIDTLFGEVKSSESSKPTVSIGDKLRMFVEQKRLSPGERDFAMELILDLLDDGFSSDDILDCCVYVYEHGMIGDGLEGSRPKMPFRYLAKAFAFVLERVKKRKSFAADLRDGELKERQAEEQKLAEANSKFCEAFPDAEEREKALELLTRKYRDSLPESLRWVNPPPGAVVMQWMMSGGSGGSA